MEKTRKYHDERQLYKDYQWVWDFTSSYEEYKELSDFVINKIYEFQNYETRSVLHLGCGSGYMDYHLKKHFEITGADLSVEMVSSAKARNPECEYFKGDMRNFSIDKKFDAVVIPDSIDYMMTVEDINRVYQNAKQLLCENGLLLVIVGYEPDKFPQNRTTVHKSSDDDIEVTFIENNYVPDLSNNLFEATFIFIIREKGKQEIVIDEHELGLFNRAIWLNEMNKAGFTAEIIDDPYLVEIEQEGTYLLIGKK